MALAPAVTWSTCRSRTRWPQTGEVVPAGQGDGPGPAKTLARAADSDFEGFRVRLKPASGAGRALRAASAARKVFRPGRPGFLNWILNELAISWR